MVIQHNMMSLNAQGCLKMNTTSKGKSTEKLSSGYRINRAADDAAGLSISETMRKMIKGLDRSSTNIEDGTSLVQVADGAMDTLHSILQRCNVLSIQAANGTLSESDRQAIQNEIDQNITEINRISETTEFNMTKIFQGSGRHGLHPIVSDVQLGDTPEIVTPTEHDKGVFAMDDKITVNNPDGPGTQEVNGVQINFSKVRPMDLTDKSFYVTCSASCNQIFKFSFNSGEGDNVRVGYPSNSLYVDVDVKGLSSGEQAVRKIGQLLSSLNSTLYADENKDNDSTYQIGHANYLDISGGVMKFYPDGGRGSTGLYGGSTKLVDDKGKVLRDGGNWWLGSVYATELDMEHIGATLHSNEPEHIKGTRYYPIQNINIQAGAETSEFVGIPLYSMNAKDMGIEPLSVMTAMNATEAIDKIGDALAYVSAIRSEYGALQNRLEHGKSVNDISTENTTAAESRIRDTDMAKEMVKYSKDNILEQASQSMLTQANSSLESVLSLLQ